MCIRDRHNTGEILISQLSAQTAVYKAVRIYDYKWGKQQKTNKQQKQTKSKLDLYMAVLVVSTVQHLCVFFTQHGRMKSVYGEAESAEKDRLKAAALINRNNTMHACTAVH